MISGIKRRYQKLDVWQNAYRLALSIYKLTDDFPRSEEYGLKSQIRKCSLSIPSNIAEGYMRQHLNEYIQFLSIALGSAGELETQLRLARDMEFLSKEYFAQLEEANGIVIAMLIKLIKALKQRKILMNG